MASWVCVSGFVPNWLSVSVFRSSVCVVSLAMRRPSKSLARVSLRYMPLYDAGSVLSSSCSVLCRWVVGEKVASLRVVCEIPIDC